MREKERTLLYFILAWNTLYLLANSYPSFKTQHLAQSVQYRNDADADDNDGGDGNTSSSGYIKLIMCWALLSALYMHCLI